MSLGLIILHAPYYKAGLSSLRSSLYMENDLLDNLYMAVRRDGIRWFGNKFLLAYNDVDDVL